MNALTNNKQLTMSSREIAAVVNSRHDKVKLSMERLQEKGLIRLTPMGEVNEGGQTVQVYHVGKRDSYIVVAQLSPEFTAVLVDRWQELESKQAPAALTQDEQLLALAQGVIKLTAERDEAIKTKALISDKRTATLMNKASQDSKRIKKLEDQIQSEGDYLSIIGAKLPERVDTEITDNKQTWRLLTGMSKTMGYETKKVPCPRYGEVKAYHVDVIAAFKKTYL